MRDKITAREWGGLIVVGVFGLVLLITSIINPPARTVTYVHPNGKWEQVELIYQGNGWVKVRRSNGDVVTHLDGMVIHGK